jgi:hypothetical protein
MLFGEDKIPNHRLMLHLCRAAVSPPNGGYIRQWLVGAAVKYQSRLKLIVSNLDGNF